MKENEYKVDYTVARVLYAIHSQYAHLHIATDSVSLIQNKIVAQALARHTHA